MRNKVNPARGGKTIIDLTSPQGIDGQGVAICHENDNFNRRLGNIKALGRAYSDLKQRERAIGSDYLENRA